MNATLIGGCGWLVRIAVSAPSGHRDVTSSRGVGLACSLGISAVLGL